MPALPYKMYCRSLVKVNMVTFKYKVGTTHKTAHLWCLESLALFLIIPVILINNVECLSMKKIATPYTLSLPVKSKRVQKGGQTLHDQKNPYCTHCSVGKKMLHHIAIYTCSMASRHTVCVWEYLPAQPAKVPNTTTTCTIGFSHWNCGLTSRDSVYPRCRSCCHRTSESSDSMEGGGQDNYHKHKDRAYTRVIRTCVGQAERPQT